MMIIKNTTKKMMLSIIASLLVFTSLFSFTNSSTQKVEADLDPASKLICMFDDGKTLVNFYSTDYFHYIMRSKSAVTSIDNVNAIWLNKFLEVSGFDFNKTNETILGRPLNPTAVPEGSTAEANKSAPRVSAFDRFGVAGLKWSSYQGEWKYYHVDACSNSDRVSPTNYGAFYDGRLEPKSTHNEIATSIDVRSIQFNKGVLSNFATAFTDTISNLLFTVTKAIVSLTIVFVGLSFTDVTTLFGMLDKDGNGDGTASNLFTDLFNGVFSGFILITFLFTALFIIYKGLIKRELRFALNTLIKTILIFVVAVIIASNPAYWIGIPNKAATYGQALVLSSMNGLYTDTSTALCETDVASINEGVAIDLTKSEDLKTQFDKTNENMKSMIGCKMWETLLFKPWVRGQFGAEYEDLDNTKVKNNNEAWVGVPSVPVGNDISINNWALFHLSTQTNAHASVGGEGLPVVINGVNGDWWRTADALSNYEEEQITEVDSSGVNRNFQVPVQTTPTEFWQSWVGNNRTERFGVAFISIIFGIVGSIAPLVFGIASAVYGLGITLLMMVSPVFLLLGTWGGRGDKIFNGWLSALVNTTIKKVGVGLLLIISLSFSMIIMGMIGEIGFIKSFLLMVIVSAILIKNKDKLLDMIASVDFGGSFNPLTKANQLMNAQKKSAKEIANIGVAAIAGGVAAKKSGQSISSGVRVGVGRQIKNRLYTSSMGMEIIRQSDISKGGEKIGRHTCVTCHMPLGFNTKEVAYQDDYGNYYCKDCADETGLENMYEVIAGQEEDVNKSKSLRQLYEQEGEKAPVMPKDIRSINSRRKSWMSHKNMRDAMEMEKVGDEYTWNDKKVQKTITTNIVKLREDMVVYSNLQMKLGRRINMPSPPEPLLDYIDVSLINMAWTDRRFDVIEETYKEAWKHWYADNSQFISKIDEEHVNKFYEEMEKTLAKPEYNVDEHKAVKLMEEFLKDESPQSKVKNSEKDLYVYVNGELVLNNKHVEETDKRLSRK